MKNLLLCPLSLLLLLPSFGVFAQTPEGLGNGLPTLSPEVTKRIEARMPKPLPNTGAAKRESSDVTEENLKGKVKRMVEYRRLFSGTTTETGWHFSSAYDYDENGDLTKSIYFHGDNVPDSLRVYGYLDGRRVSKLNSYDENPARLSIVGRAPQTPLHKPDERYDLSYEYTYKDGQLKEWKLTNSDGTRWMRYVYERSPEARWYAAFDEEDKINQKYVFKLDKDGNDIEMVAIDVRKVYGHDTTYLITYQAFDRIGNWIQRTFTRIDSNDGKQTLVPLYEESRTITYY